jgi:hypothetical protein
MAQACLPVRPGWKACFTGEKLCRAGTARHITIAV